MNGKFEKGKRYSNRQIRDVIGGDVQKFLPMAHGQVVGALLRPELNPGAPAVILVGEGDDRSRRAKTLVAQGGSIPIFIKRGTDDWEFVGHFQVTSSTRDRRRIRRHADLVGHQVKMLIFLEEVAE